MKLSLKNFEKEAAAEIHKPEQVNDLLHTENDIAMIQWNKNKMS